MKALTMIRLKLMLICYPQASPMSTPLIRPHRLESVDWLRGFMMIIMALDHLRDFLSPSAADPLNAPNVSGLPYATRWITHASKRRERNGGFPTCSKGSEEFSRAR